MTSPFEKAAADLAREAKLPITNWRQKRIDAIEGHIPSIETVARSIGKMGTYLFDGQLATDLQINGSDGVNVDITRPGDVLYEQFFHIVPTRGKWTPRISERGGFNWTPDVAMQVEIALKDRYDYSVKGQRPQPTGDVELWVNALSWGRLPQEETDKIDAISDNPERTWSNRGNSHDINHTSATARRLPGETLEAFEVEALFTPIALQALRHFDTVRKNAVWKQHQTPGNFSTNEKSSTVYRPSERADSAVALSRPLRILEP